MRSSTEAESKIFLVGNPNAGKSLLFNLLTGLRTKVANYPGITIEKKSGRLLQNHNVEVTDLPGIYSLFGSSQDEVITTELVTSQIENCSQKDGVVAVVDSTQLKKGLYLVSELKERNQLEAVVLTMGDLVGNEAGKGYVNTLQSRIGVPVFFISAAKNTGISDLIKHLTSRNSKRENGENKVAPQDCLSFKVRTLKTVQNHHKTVESWLENLKLNSWSSKNTEKIDRIVLHPILGPFLLLLVFFALFEGLFLGSKPIVSVIDELKNSTAVFTKGIFGNGSLLGSLVADGLIGGVGSVLSFVPLIAFLFLFLGALEDSGYMARAVFLLHRIMSRVGLSGRAFVPLVSGFSCSVPAIMSTRIMESWSERLVTILITPLISCSARLPIYGLLIAVAFSQIPPVFGIFDVGAIVMVFMYVFGILLAFLMAATLRYGLVKGQRTPLLLEMPDYRWPRPMPLWFSVRSRVIVFVKEAGTIILALTVLLWALFTFPTQNPSNQLIPGHATASAPFGEVSSSHLENSYAGQLGHLIEPIIEPLGFNWKIGIGLVASLAAREVFISTFGLIYGLSNADDSPPSLVEAMHSDLNPNGRPTYSPLVAFSLLVFFAVSLQCMSTFAVTRRETASWRWPLFQLGYLNLLAWVLSFIVFQGGTALGY